MQHCQTLFSFLNLISTPQPLNLEGLETPTTAKEVVALQGRSFALPLIAINASGSLLNRVKGGRGH